MYLEVAACRSIVVGSAAKKYHDKGNAAQKAEDELRSEVISVLPVIESPASVGCYCAVNEIAKAESYSAFVAVGDKAARMDAVSARLQEAICSNQIGKAMLSLAEESANDARLK